MKSYCLSLALSFLQSLLHRLQQQRHSRFPGSSAAAQGGAPGWINIALLIGIIYLCGFLFFAHSQKGQKSKKNFWASLTPGIEVITAVELLGTVVEVKKVLSL